MEWQQIQIHPLGGIPGGSVPCHQDPPCPVCAGASREVSVRDKCVLSSQAAPGVHSVHTLQQAESGSQVEEQPSGEREEGSCPLTALSTRQSGSASQSSSHCCPGQCGDPQLRPTWATF